MVGLAGDPGQSQGTRPSRGRQSDRSRLDAARLGGIAAGTNRRTGVPIAQPDWPRPHPPPRAGPGDLGRTGDSTVARRSSVVVTGQTGQDVMREGYLRAAGARPKYPARFRLLRLARSRSPRPRTGRLKPTSESAASSKHAL